MKSEMTEKDKKLLTFLVLIVVVVGIGYWGIKPQIQKINKINTLVSDEQDEKKENETKTNMLSSIELENDELTASIGDAEKKFYPVMSSDEIDNMLTGNALDLGLDCYELTIEMPDGPSSRQAYQYSKLYETQQAELASESTDDTSGSDTSGSDTSGSDTTTESVNVDSNTSGSTESGTDEKSSENGSSTESAESLSGGNTDIEAATATIVLNGDTKALQKYVNDIISSDKYIFLKSYTWGDDLNALDDGETASAGDAEKTARSISITVEIYMNNLASATDASASD